MELVEFVATHALQINSRCLALLGGGDGEGLPDAVRSTLGEEAERLAALHHLLGQTATIDTSISEVLDAADVVRRRRLIAELAAGAQSGKARRALFQLAPLTAGPVSSEFFLHDSSYWRELDSSAFARKRLIERMVGSYRKARKAHTRPSDAKRSFRHVHRVVAHLELLGPDLSDSFSARRWYLANMAGLWRERVELNAIGRLVRAQVEKRKGRRKTLQVVSEREQRIALRIDQLVACSFDEPPKRYRAALRAAASKRAREEE